MPVYFIPGGPGASQGANGGKVWAFNNIGSSPVAVLASNSLRQMLTFHNPGPNDILVYPTINAIGGANTPTTSNPGGGFRVYGNGGTLIVSGECQQPWAALAFSGSSQPLTVMESNVS